MSEYLTDDEKAERVKRWWADHGASILLGLALGIAGLVAWNWWGGREEARAEQASELFQVAQMSVEIGDYDRAEALIGDLEQGARGTPYRALALALRAEVATRRALTDNDGAESADAAAIESAIEAARAARERLSERRDRELRELFALRLARLYVAKGDVASARAVLGEVRSQAYRGLVLEVEGDIAMAEGDLATARERFEAAIDAGVDHEALRLKRDAAAS